MTAVQQNETEVILDKNRKCLTVNYVLIIEKKQSKIPHLSFQQILPSILNGQNHLKHTLLLVVLSQPFAL